MGLWAGSLINLLSSIGPPGQKGPFRALMRRMRSKMRRMRSKMRSKMRKMRRKMRSKMRKMRTQCEDAFPEGTPNSCKQNSIVATLFRSKIIAQTEIHDSIESHARFQLTHVQW